MRTAGWSLLLVLFLSALARADTPPNVWDVAKDPRVLGAWTLHLRVQRLLLPPPDDEDPMRIEPRQRERELRLEAARALLEDSDAAHAADVRLRFDLGTVDRLLGDLQGVPDLYEQAVKVLQPAIDSKPDDPAATGALESLVYSYAKLDRPREELATWRRYIPRLIDDRARVVAMMNMGEAEMRLARVDDALATFREVVRMCGSLPNTAGVASTYVLALWDLAVALDRSGDPRAALEKATEVVHMNGLPLLQSDSVFFVPEWERTWYLALGATVEAREEGDPVTAARYWERADFMWSQYVEKAEWAGGKDPWLPIARLRRASTHAARLAADKRAAHAPHPVRD